jgi:hypothetical protein
MPPTLRLNAAVEQTETGQEEVENVLAHRGPRVGGAAEHIVQRLRELFSG